MYENIEKGVAAAGLMFNPFGTDVIIMSVAALVALSDNPSIVPVTVPDTLPCVFVKEKLKFSAFAGEVLAKIAVALPKTKGRIRECKKLLIVIVE